MIWALTVGTFFATLIVLAALSYAFTSGESWMIRRLSHLSGSASQTRSEAFAKQQKELARTVLASVGKLVPGRNTPRTQLMMIRAGYRSPNAILAVRGLKVLLPVALVSAVYFTGLYSSSPLAILLGAVFAGILLPEFWILWRVDVRQQQLRRAIPDALDLLVICVEAGLGLDQAFLRVAQELALVYPELSEELQLVNFEMRMGKSRLDALRDLARRTGIEDVKALVAMLAQTERFGTSVAQSLRVHSDEMRVRRRQRAEEMAAKTTVKMVPPLVLFVFPALLVVIIGPAVLIMVRQFLSVVR
jgi:tight adherence protein C